MAKSIFDFRYIWTSLSNTQIYGRKRESIKTWLLRTVAIQDLKTSIAKFKRARTLSASALLLDNLSNTTIIIMTIIITSTSTTLSASAHMKRTKQTRMCTKHSERKCTTVG